MHRHECFSCCEPLFLFFFNFSGFFGFFFLPFLFVLCLDFGNELIPHSGDAVVNHFLGSRLVLVTSFYHETFLVVLFVLVLRKVFQVLQTFLVELQLRLGLGHHTLRLTSVGLQFSNLLS